MQITLNQEEIQSAIDTYVRDQITIADDQEISIDLRAGRGENSFTAILNIRAVSDEDPDPADDYVPAAAKKTTPRRTIKAAAPVKLNNTPVGKTKTAEDSKSETVTEYTTATTTEPAETPEEPATQPDDVSAEVAAAATEPRKGSIFQFGNNVAGG